MYVQLNFETHSDAEFVLSSAADFNIILFKP